MPRDGQGNPVASFGRGRLNDDIRKQHASKAIDPKSRPEGKQPDPDAETGMVEDTPEPIQDVVTEHGPAHTVHTEHDHDGGKHRVTSFHGEHGPGKMDGHGFTHRSTHASSHEAHKHMGHALGVGVKEHDEEAAEQGGEGERAKGMAIPGLG